MELGSRDWTESNDVISRGLMWPIALREGKKIRACEGVLLVLRFGGRDDRWLQFDAPKMAVATKEQRAQGTVVVVVAGKKRVNEGDGKARRPGIVYGSIRHTKGEGGTAHARIHTGGGKRCTLGRTVGEPRAEGRERRRFLNPLSRAEPTARSGPNQIVATIDDSSRRRRPRPGRRRG